MGVEKVLIKPGNGIDFPRKHDEVSMEYTGNTTLLAFSPMSHKTSGWLYDDDAPDHKGTK
jgi:FK506-binding protein 1